MLVYEKSGEGGQISRKALELGIKNGKANKNFRIYCKHGSFLIF
jgi:hypothetical protein